VVTVLSTTRTRLCFCAIFEIKEKSDTFICGLVMVSQKTTLLCSSMAFSNSVSLFTSTNLDWMPKPLKVSLISESVFPNRYLEAMILSPLLKRAKSALVMAAIPEESAMLPNPFSSWVRVCSNNSTLGLVILEYAWDGFLCRKASSISWALSKPNATPA